MMKKKVYCSCLNWSFKYESCAPISFKSDFPEGITDIFTQIKNDILFERFCSLDDKEWNKLTGSQKNMKIKNSCLIVSKKYCSSIYKVSRCLLCNTLLYISVKGGNDFILVNKYILLNSSKEAKESQEYSKAFKLRILGRHRNLAEGENDSTSSIKFVLENQLKIFLHKEQIKMFQRISSFKKREEEKFYALQKQSREQMNQYALVIGNITSLRQIKDEISTCMIMNEFSDNAPKVGFRPRSTINVNTLRHPRAKSVVDIEWNEESEKQVSANNSQVSCSNTSDKTTHFPSKSKIQDDKIHRINRSNSLLPVSPSQVRNHNPELTSHLSHHHLSSLHKLTLLRELSQSESLLFESDSLLYFANEFSKKPKARKPKVTVNNTETTPSCNTNAELQSTDVSEVSSSIDFSEYYETLRDNKEASQRSRANSGNF